MEDIKHLRPTTGEDDNEFLDHLLNSLVVENVEENRLNDGYRDVWKRIYKKRIRRNIYLISGSVAAAIILLILILPPSPQISEFSMVVQLNNMGIKVYDEQVQLIIDNSSSINLGDAAKINIDNNAQIALQSADGKKIELQNEKSLKIYVPVGKRFNIELSDGTQVWLNADTWFEYPATFNSQQERRVKIEGEGFFEVQHDATKPFFVEMPNNEEIRVLGTSFNVSAYSENEDNIATLLNGKIAYHILNSRETINLSPNEQLIVNKNTNHIQKNEVNASEFTMWKEGVIYFNNEKLSVLAKKLSRMYGIEINVSEKFKDARFEGKIGYERGLDYITELLTTTSNIKCVVENGTIYLK